MPEVSQKSRTTTFVLVFLFGIFGFHRFYVGKTGTGKSTLARWLWATQYGPTSGHRWRVLIDVEDIYELVPEKGVWQGTGEPDWRAQVIGWQQWYSTVAGQQP